MANNEMAKGGGIKQSKPQETDSTYSKAIDKKVAGKPVGYRFTDKLAKKLGKKPGTKPTAAEIEKYKNRGVYFETRKNKSDINPKAKLEGGGENEYAKGGQTAPQRESYSKRGDKEVKAKPVGYRFTEKLANRLGKNVFTKPTQEQIEKYRGKGVYFENRKDKSDINPKAMFMHGGHDDEVLGNGKKLDHYTAVGIAEGFEEKQDWNDELKAWAYIQRHGLTRSLQGWFGRTAEEMIDRGLFDRKGNIDWEVANEIWDEDDEYAKGGQTKSHYIELDVFDFDSSMKRWCKRNDITYKIIEEEGPAGGAPLVKFFGKKEDLKSLIDKYYSDNDDVEFWYEEIKSYAKGGQTAPQRESYSKRGDKEVKAKPVGYRFTEKLANRLGKNVFTKPTQEQIEKYRGRGVYFENRKDKSDINPRAMFEEGGDMEYARGGQTAPQRESYSKRGDKEVKAKPVGYRFTEKLANRLGKNVFTKPTQEQIEKYRGKGVYFENRKDKSDINPRAMFEEGGDMEYAKGGQTAPQRESYSKRGDKEVKAKPVGYRFTKSLAKRLGKNPFTKPSAEEVRKYLGKGVYFENRKDKSDINPRAMFEQGGDMEYAKGGQTAPQETDSTYSKSIDKRKGGKPVGYRFTNKLANKLGKKQYTKPTAAEIEKYSGKGVYFETRKNKSDLNPKAKLEGGGESEYARGGGVPRTSNADSKAYTENHLPFMANNLEGKTLENGDYVVLSYGYYPIWFWHKRTNKWYGNKDKFSVTTAKHISQSRPTYEAEMLSRGEMDSLMSKSIEGKDFKEMGGTLDSFVVAQQ